MPSQRHAIEVKFAAADNNKSLLIAVDAGGVCLNITAAPVLIQTEIWWNDNTELQAPCRVFRQSQTEDIDAFRVEGEAYSRVLIFLLELLSQLQRNGMGLVPAT